MRSSIPAVDESVGLLYAAHEVEPPFPGAHFTLRVDPPTLVRRFTRRQAQFSLDGESPYLPLPISMAVPMLEGGLNWSIGSRATHLIAIHSATLERDGVGLMMPAPPGSGKSTLCAALVARGWRLLSDEFGLIDPTSGELIPVPRPIALKDRSRDVIGAWWPEAVFGRSVLNNEGQLVSYVRPPVASVDASARRCKPGLVVVPRYREGAHVTVSRLTRARTVMHLADSSFNYNLHGRIGFDRLVEIAHTASAVVLEYSRLDDGVRAVGDLLAACPTK